MLTRSEENYLKTIFHLSEGGKREVNTNSVAESLNTKPASVSDMIKKLSSKSLLSYQKYKGVNVSDQGKTEALKVIRKHRLWEVFLVDKLKFNWDEVHEIAEQLEHIKSPDLVNRLDQFLGYPTVDPHGDPIPDEHGEINIGAQVSLADADLNSRCMVVAVDDANSALLKHLDRIKIQLGTRFKIIEKIDFDSSILIQIEGGSEIFLSKKITNCIMVSQL